VVWHLHAVGLAQPAPEIEFSVGFDVAEEKPALTFGHQGHREGPVVSTSYPIIGRWESLDRKVA
tara:strand:+ start:616 stop:807 length:192 start_codon:yes stop_codon:yes gene_type:complete